MKDTILSIIKLIGLDNWISILCALIGLLGVYYTIQFTRNQFKDDKRIGIKPYLDLRLKDKFCVISKGDTSNLDSKYFNEHLNFIRLSNYNSMLSIFYIELDIENIGLGHALNCKVVDIYGENRTSEISENLIVLKQEEKSKIWLYVEKIKKKEYIELFEKAYECYVEELVIIEEQLNNGELIQGTETSDTINEELKSISKEEIYIDIEYNDMLDNKYKKTFCIELYYYVDMTFSICRLNGDVRVLNEKSKDFQIKKTLRNKAL